MATVRRSADVRARERPSVWVRDDLRNLAEDVGHVPENAVGPAKVIHDLKDERGAEGLSNR